MESRSRFDPAQAASAAQFNRQHDRYGMAHVLADTADVVAGLDGIPVPQNGRALDVATGGGHAALCLARLGWRVTIGDVAVRMLESARTQLARNGFAVEARLFPAEQMPFAAAMFDLVTVRVAPHHFSSPASFVREVARVLKPGGHFLLIDGTVPENDPETDTWLNRVEKWRDPSHGRLLSESAWRTLVTSAGFDVVRASQRRLKQPDLEWYFETAATSADHRRKVLDAVRSASARVRGAMQLGEEEGRTVWWWPMLTLLARAPRND